LRKQVSCQDFVITIREGRHQFPWHKKQEQSRISPSDTVVVLICRFRAGKEAIVAVFGSDEFCGEGCLTDSRDAWLQPPQ
jgi:hypothetical protein